MGDFFAPKRKDVVDKLRRRLEHYRHHHTATAGRYHTARPDIYAQQKQDTLLLQKRWLESKAKKAAKQSKASRDNNNTQSDHRNLVVTKLKRKIDSVSADAKTSSSSTTTTTTAAAETVFSFEDKDHQSPNLTNNKNSNNTGGSGAKKHNPGLPSLSVQIVQQISAHPQQDTSQTIHTNVTVSSRYGNSNSPNAGGASHSVHTSVQCKQEPSEDTNSARTSTSNTTPTTTSSSAHNAYVDPVSSDIGTCIGIDDVDELQNILDSIEKDEDIEPSLLKDLNEFNEIYDKVQRDSESNESGNMYGSLACGSPGLSKGAFPNIGQGGPMSNMFDSNQNINAAAMPNPTIPVPAAIPEPTGPAAETLKQMAAQHQHQHSPGYPMKGMDHYPDGLRNGGFPPNYSQLYRSVPNTTSAFPYNQTTNHPMGDTSQMTPEMAAITYGSTKPLTHFSNEQGQQHNSPSSLQQLQNQVQSHFKPSSAAQMQITQTQHMQVSHGPHSMQLSQTQQVQMQPSPQQISMTQQQNFNIGQQQMVSDQMKMQMMEKMRMEQQQQQAQQGRMPPQYMGRPPPEYKMHPNARPQGSYPNTSAASGNQNPLQTIQNMVNQTSAYGAVKSEVASATSSGQAANGMMQSTQISAMQQQTMSASMASNGPHMGNLPQSSQGIRPGFHPQQQQQHLQQPPAYSSVESSSRTQSSSTYTSAIMRNQRPPNVNVGPDGLNISQPRTHTDWPRASMMGPGHAGMRPGMPPNGAHGMTQTSAMSAHMMQYQHRPPHYGAGQNSGSMAAAAAAAAATNMAQMQQQQQQVRPTMAGQIRGGGAMMPNGSQMMMQHQSMQVSQQMSMHASSTSYNMGGPSPGATNPPNAGYNLGGPSPGANMHVGGGGSNQPSSAAQPAILPGPPTSTSSQDEFLHFLDNPLSAQPMFDSIHNSTTDDFSLFEDILNGKQ